jgi:large subunit ribosomal protein L10
VLTRSKKNELVSGLKGDIDKANAVFLTNLIGIQSNDAVAIRKKLETLVVKLS